MTPDSRVRAGKRSSSVRSDMLWMVSGTGLRGLSQWAVLFVLVKLTNPDVVGQYGLALTLALPVMIFSSLGLTRLQGSDAIRAYTFSDYGALRITSTAVALIAIAVFVSVSAPETSVLILTLAVACQLGVLNLLETFHGLFLQHGRLDTLGQGMMYSNLAILLVVVSALLLDLDISTAIILSTLALALPMILHYLPATEKIVNGRTDWAILLRPRWQATKQFGLLRIALPLGVSLLILALIAGVPRYFLVATEGTVQLGIFFALLSLLSAGTLFTEALGQTALPRLTALYSAKDKPGLVAMLRKLTILSGGLGVIVVAIAALSGPMVIGVVLAPAYSPFRFAIIGLACVFAIELVTRFVALTVVIARIIDLNVAANIVSLVFAVLSSWMLVPEYGINGAVLTLVFTACLRLVLLTILVVRHLHSFDVHPGK